MFSVGFMALLHVVMDKVVSNFPSWEGALVSIPRVYSVCEPGTYHTNYSTSAYCQDSDGEIQKSIKCIQCPENMYSSLPNQDKCIPCEVGSYAPMGSAACLSCYEDSPSSASARNTYCASFIADQESYFRKLFVAIFVPIGVVLAAIIIGALFWYFRKRFRRQRALGSDDTWLLNFDDLVSPMKYNMKDQHNKDFIKGAANERVLLGDSSTSSAAALVKHSSTPVKEYHHPQDEEVALHRFSTNGITFDNRSTDHDTLKGGNSINKRGELLSNGIKLHHEREELIHTLGFQ
jgi:hypothetical protein